jgi:hypothetical protein
MKWLLKTTKVIKNCPKNYLKTSYKFLSFWSSLMLGLRLGYRNLPKMAAFFKGLEGEKVEEIVYLFMPKGSCIYIQTPFTT